MNEGIGDAIGSLFGGTAPVSWSDLLFPVRVTGAAVVSGVTVYSWTEQLPYPVDGQLQDAYPASTGTATLKPAFELNNNAVLTPPFYAWCRPRGIFNRCMAYDLMAPLGTSGTYYNTYEQYISGEETFGPGEQTYFVGPGSTINYGTAGPTGQPAPVINYIQDVTEVIYPGTVWLLQTIDGSGTLVSTVLRVTVDALGVATLFTDVDWSSVTGAADGKVYVTTNDTVSNYLASTLVAGTGITLTVVNPGSDETLEVATTGPHWVPVTKSYTDLADASMSHTFTLYSLPAKGVLHAVVVKHTTAFTGGGLSSVTVQVQDPAGTPLTATFNVFNSPLSTSFSTSPGTSSNLLPTPYDFSSAVNLKILVQTAGANMDQATAGSLTVDLLISTLP